MDTVSIISRLSTLLVVLVLCFSAMRPHTVAQSSALLWFVPIEEGEGSTGNGEGSTGNPKVAIQLDHASDVYGAEVQLSFDATALAVVDADKKLPGVQVSPGFCPKPGFVARNRVQNQEGTIEYILTQLNPQVPCNDGIVAMIEFRCLAPGKSPLRITSSLVVALGASVIAHTTQDGIVNCQAPRHTYQLYFPLLLRDGTDHPQAEHLAYLPLIIHNHLSREQEKLGLQGIIRFVKSLRMFESWRE